ncbi:hypothetical protein Tco_0450718 [Tanacetum coccineum]
MKTVSTMDAKFLWGNSTFDYKVSEANGNSGVLMEKRQLWNYIISLISRFHGECILMGDFNEVRNADERMGSIFNSQGAADFNDFILNAGLSEVQLEGTVIGSSSPSASRSNLAIKGVMVDGTWVDDPGHVKNEFCSHFATRFQSPSGNRGGSHLKNHSSTSQPLEQVQNHDENDVFANVRRHSEQPESINDTYVLEKDDSNVIPDSSNICTNDNQVDQNAAECVDERAALANLIANLTLDMEENKTVLKQLKKANASLTKKMKKCKTHWMSLVGLGENLPQIRKQAVRNTNVIAPGPSRNCPKHVSHQSPREKVGSNDMVHNYYLEKAKKSAQLQKDKEVNGKPSMIDPTRLPNTANGCKPKPRNWQVIMSSRVQQRCSRSENHRKQKPSSSAMTCNVLPAKSAACIVPNHDECV